MENPLFECFANGVVILFFYQLFKRKTLMETASTQIIRELKNQLETMKSKYEKCINTIRKIDAGIIGMYNL